jgi:hypothetical protein
MSNIINGTTFNASQIRYTVPKVTNVGGKTVGILSTVTNGALKIQTPMILNWGASDYEGNNKFEVSLQFPNEEYNTPELQLFRQNMVDFENKIKADALVNSKAWFGKQHNSPEVLEALWTPILRYPKDKTTGDFDKTKAPTLKVKIQQHEGKWKTEVYDTTKTILFPSETNSSPIDLIRKGTKIIALIQCTGLWFISGKFGVTWKLIQSVVPTEQFGQQGCLIQIDGVPANVPDLKRAVSESVTESATLVEDSDDEENDIPVEQPPVAEDGENAPVVETKKKRVVKKKD